MSDASHRPRPPFRRAAPVRRLATSDLDRTLVPGSSLLDPVAVTPDRRYRAAAASGRWSVLRLR